MNTKMNGIQAQNFLSRSRKGTAYQSNQKMQEPFDPPGLMRPMPELGQLFLFNLVGDLGRSPVIRLLRREGPLVDSPQLKRFEMSYQYRK